jgi:acyl-coenzyme A synthetase/AMP-(fatty) acid ligase
MLRSAEVGSPFLVRTAPGDPTRHRPGRPRHECEARVVGTDEQAAEDGEAGELWVRPADRSQLMIGYLNSPASTARAFTDGGYRSGDGLVRESGGDFVFVGRAA